MKNIVIVVTLDTKGPETKYVKELIEGQGHRVIVIDGACMEGSFFEGDYSAEYVARISGSKLEEVRAIPEAGAALKIMEKGAKIIAKELYERGELDGIFGLGGGMNSTFASAVMKELPVGVPKLLVSTKVGDPESPQFYVGDKDITLMPSIADIAGLNKITNQILANAAFAISNMVNAPKIDKSGKPTVVLTMIGLTTAFGLRVKSILEEKGYEVVVFHAMGIGGRCLEPFVAKDPDVVAVIEGCLWEIGNFLFGGMSNAGPHRLIEAGKKGLPQVIVPGASAYIAFRGLETVPEKYKNRPLHEHNPKATPMLLKPDEAKIAGETIAERLNKATGPVEVLIPTRGLGSLTGKEGTPFYKIEKELGSEKALIEGLKSKLSKNIPVKEVEAHINDPKFADLVVESFMRIRRQRS